MRRTTVAIGVLSSLLVISNGFWLFLTIDNALTMTYRDVQCADENRALHQLLAVVPVAARPEHDRASVLEAALGAGDPDRVFEKDGHVWVDAIGLRFDARDRLAEVRTSWSFE
ncbi:MAG: hypothetical protein AAF430_18145 [Myxococcota bacterium]